MLHKYLLPLTTKDNMEMFSTTLLLPLIALFCGLGQVSWSCSIEAQVCYLDMETGLLKIDNNPVSSWSCGDFLEDTFHVAFVAPNCKYYELLDTFDPRDVDSFYSRWHQVPSGAYFIMVSSKGGIHAFKDLWRSSLKHALVWTLLEDWGVSQAYQPENNVLLSVGVKYDVTYKQCKKSVAGLEYRGTVNTIQNSLCVAWKDTKYTSSLFPNSGLQVNYCRNPDHDQAGPWCFHLNSKGNLEKATCHQIPFCDDSESGMVLVARKGYNYSPKQGFMKLVNTQQDSTVVFYDFSAEEDFCMEALTPNDLVLIQSGSGLQINRKQSTVIPSEEVIVTLSHSEPVRCSHDNNIVIGWEFVPARTGTLYLTVMRQTEGEASLTRVGTTELFIPPDWIEKELSLKYQCIRSQPITGVEVGDQFGFYTMQNENIPMLKHVYPQQYSQLKYPCARQLTWADVGVYTLYNVNKEDIDSCTNCPYSKSSIEHMNVALRPIFSRDFLYTCQCERDSDCHRYGDSHMTCRNSTCQCEVNYSYNRKANLCLYEQTAVNKEAFQQGDQNQVHPAESAAGLAVDESTSSDQAVGTFSTTRSPVSGIMQPPWWVVDLGSVTTVHSVRITTPKPYEVYAELWQSRYDFTSGKSPDATFYDFEKSYKKLQESFGLTGVQVIVIHGVLPWRLTSRSGRSFILNKNQVDGRKFYSEEDFGNLGSDIDAVEALAHVGDIYGLYDIDCLTLSSDQVLSAASSGECQQSLDSSKSLQFAVEEITGNIGVYSLLAVEKSMYIGIDEHSFDLILSEEAMAFAFYITDLQRLADHKVSVMELQNENIGVFITASHDHLRCLFVEESRVMLSSMCTQRFYLKSRIRVDQVYTLHPVVSNSDAVVTVEGKDDYHGNSLTRPCFQLTSEGSIGVGFIDMNNDYELDIKFNSNSENTTSSNRALLKTSYPNLHNFTVGVSMAFDLQHSFNPMHFITCAIYPGYVTPGLKWQIDCTNPVLGRYLAIYRNKGVGATSERIQLSNVEVYSLDCSDTNCDSKHVDSCLNHDCQQYCIAADSSYKCSCFRGYQLAENGINCTDVNECSENNGGCQYICVNTEGNFYCQCSQGFYLTIDNHCKDVNECWQNNGGCHHNCINSIGSFRCRCRAGYAESLSGAVCIGDDTLHLRSALEMDWDPAYADTSNQSYIKLKEQIENNLNKYICLAKTLVQDLSQCLVDGPFKQNTVVVFDFIIVTYRDLSDQDKTQLTKEVELAIEEQDSVFSIFGNEVKVRTPLMSTELQLRARKLAWNSDNPCLVYHSHSVCQNGGECTVKGTIPMCNCPSGYVGQSCEARIPKGFNPRSFIIAFVVFTILWFVQAVSMLSITTAKPRQWVTKAGFEGKPGFDGRPPVFKTDSADSVGSAYNAKEQFISQDRRFLAIPEPETDSLSPYKPDAISSASRSSTSEVPYIIISNMDEDDTPLTGDSPKLLAPSIQNSRTRRPPFAGQSPATEATTNK